MQLSVAKGKTIRSIQQIIDQQLQIEIQDGTIDATVTQVNAHEHEELSFKKGYEILKKNAEFLESQEEPDIDNSGDR